MTLVLELPQRGKNIISSVNALIFFRFIVTLTRCACSVFYICCSNLSNINPTKQVSVLRLFTDLIRLTGAKKNKTKKKSTSNMIFVNIELR